MTNTQDTTAIVTYGRGWPALTTVRSLGARGVRVVCGDSVPMTPSSFSKHCARSFRYPDPKADPEGFLAKIEAVIKEELARGGEVVLMPVHSETYLISEHRRRFEWLGAKMALPDLEDIQRTHDKGSLAQLAEELGITIPRTHRFTSLADVYALAHDVNYPAFVKVRGAAAGVGVEKVDGPEELVSTYRSFVEGYELEPEQFPLVQEFAPGSDVCLSALFDDGECVAIHAYRNIRQFPRTTGAGVLRESVHVPEAEAVAKKLLGHLRWHGLAQLDFRWDEESEPTLIELNPRFFGGLPQAVAAGVDYPWLVLQLALGHPFDLPDIDYEVRTETPILGLLASADAVVRDDALTVREALAPHRGTVNDVFRLSDPLPVLGVFYPLAVFLKHGSLSTAVVLSEASMKTAAVARQGLRGHLKPSARTLAVTAAAFLLSVLATTWAVTDGTILGALFSLPATISSAVFPSGGAATYALFHVANFCFLYVLAAAGLKLREEVQAARAETAAAA